MGYQHDIDVMPDLCRRPLSLQQFHGEGRKVSDLQSCQVAYRSLFRVDLEYTYAPEERLLREDASGEFSQLLTTTISSEAPYHFVSKYPFDLAVNFTSCLSSLPTV